MEFLRSISKLCRTAKDRGLWRGLSVFCNKYELAEHVKVMGHPLVALGGVQGQAVGTGLSRGLAGQTLCGHSAAPDGLGDIEKPRQWRPRQQGGGRAALWVPQLGGGTGAPLALLTCTSSAGAADLCRQMPGPIPLVLCRCCWKRSPWNICTQRCGSKPCSHSAT